ncbi:MAG: hypothetical protein IPM23_01765 [Candidatus Melainabacteria bacterium]|nr:hypothetical protein [Candidatus Melainabacteria bacterium]
MINCTIVVGPERKAAQLFFECTQRCVCVKKVEDAALSIRVDLPTFMKVEVDKEPVYTEELAAGAYVKTLPEIFASSPVEHRCLMDLPIFHFTRQNKTAEKKPLPRHFKVVFADADNHHRMVATFEFKLLDCQQYMSEEGKVDELHHPEVSKPRCGCQEGK